MRVDSLRLIHRRGAGTRAGHFLRLRSWQCCISMFCAIDPANPDWAERDRFILCKGHASAVLYAALARRGFFTIAELDNWGEVDCPHQGHPDRFKTPGVEMTSGILGHGVAIGAGLALAARLKIGLPHLRSAR